MVINWSLAFTNFLLTLSLAGIVLVGSPSHFFATIRSCINISHGLNLIESNEIMLKITTAVLIISFLASCSSFLHNMHKFQSDNRLRKTEDSNFLGEKALTQWWYFDFFFDDGSVLVLMFVPHHWWTDPEKEPDGKTLIYTSYLKANGELTISEKVIDSNEVQYDENSLKCSYIEIIRSHNNKKREYTINFFLDKIEGSATIASKSKAFSPLPTGSLGSFGNRLILKKKGKYRYAAHVPQGDVTGNLIINNSSFGDADI